MAFKLSKSEQSTDLGIDEKAICSDLLEIGRQVSEAGEPLLNLAAASLDAAPLEEGDESHRAEVLGTPYNASGLCNQSISNSEALFSGLAIEPLKSAGEEMLRRTGRHLTESCGSASPRVSAPNFAVEGLGLRVESAVAQDIPFQQLVGMLMRIEGQLSSVNDKLNRANDFWRDMQRNTNPTPTVGW